MKLNYRKRRIDKKKMMGKIQIVLGILLLIGAVAGWILACVGYQDSVQNNINTLNRAGQEIKELRMEGNLSQEAVLSIAIESSLIYTQEDHFISQKLISERMGFVLMIAISFLFITQGKANLWGKE